MTCSILGHNSAACALANTTAQGVLWFRLLGQGDEYVALGSWYDQLRQVGYDDWSSLHLLSIIGRVARYIDISRKTLPVRLSDTAAVDLLCFFFERMKYGKERLMKVRRRLK